MGCNDNPNLLNSISKGRWPIAGKNSVWKIRTYDLAGVLADPLTLVVRVQLSGEVPITTYTFGVDSELTQDGTGLFTFVLPVDVTGKTHKMDVVTTGNDASVQGFFEPLEALVL